MGVAGLSTGWPGRITALRAAALPDILDAMPPWPWYLLVLVAMVLLSIAIYYSPFFVMDQLRRRRSPEPIPNEPAPAP